MQKKVLSVKINDNLYQKLKKSVHRGQVSYFVEELIRKELITQEEKLAEEREKFRLQLIADYRSASHDSELNQELADWDQALNDGLDKHE